jgi:hypothetical protein
MKKKMIDCAITVAVLLAMTASAYAHDKVKPSNAPDSCATSLLCAGAVAGLGLLRKFLR